ncbi:serine/threonine-protein kinase [Paractinoplanes deccanensis]|uniref:serine/threonine-protein kinase n=1 Tax=Paractinoplanes deccanensis TaxID=113561 RepID=UPI001943B123|nr:serine/threonine-protein kinase [Actinoplanes deccanensis]
MQVLAGRYRLGEALGQGGSAVVHYGFDTTLKRPVAVKIFDHAAADVLREARTSAGLSHPNIAQVYDYGEVTDGPERTPYLVMEFVDGETLADRLARTGALRWRQAAEICAETASALAAAHAQSLVHRDVNPRNIMLTPDGVKVLDFGIAAAAGQNSVDTRGGLWGSPAHLAPEQLRGEPTFPAADVYALGLLLFECLTGSRAWPGVSLNDVLATRHGRPAPRLPRVSGLPRDIVRLYEACTAEDPAERPTAAAVAETFRRVAGPTPLTRPARSSVPQLRAATHSAPAAAAPAPAGKPRRSRRRATVMASAAVLTAVMSILGVQLANGADTPGGRKAEAAVEGTPPPATAPAPGSPSPSTSPTTAQVQDTTEAHTVRVRRTTEAPPKKPAAKPTTTRPPASEQPEDPTPSATPDDTPSPTDDPTTEPTDEPTDDPTEPTDDPTEPTDEPTEPTEEPTGTTPPATTEPGA